jgi:hypothetical protein
MVRGAIILLLIIVASLFIFEMFDRNAGAQDMSVLGQILQNQRLILEKLDTMDKKLDVIKIRIKL